MYASLATFHDQRDARGVRYALVMVLVFVILAKLAGEDHVRGIADWFAQRKEGLARVQAPHASTYSRVLGWAANSAEFADAVSRFFARQRGAGQSAVMSVDGKTLRGTIPAGHTHGVHLLAAYVPEEGLVLMQVEVPGQENEIRAAPQLLKCLDLRCEVVTGDAMLAQRHLSEQIVRAGGDYLWTVKDNQAELREDIEVLFQPEVCRAACSPVPKDFRTAHCVEKGHGRIEERTLTVSSMLKGYLDWPHVEQVFQLERRFVRIKDGKATHQVVHGLTSLTDQEVSAQRLLELEHSHWQIENGLHYRRDETLREDRCRLWIGHAALMMATINNLVLGLLHQQGVTDVPRARRRFSARPDEALALILRTPA